MKKRNFAESKKAQQGLISKTLFAVVFFLLTVLTYRLYWNTTTSAILDPGVATVETSRSTLTKEVSSSVSGNPAMVAEESIEQMRERLLHQDKKNIAAHLQARAAQQTKTLPWIKDDSFLQQRAVLVNSIKQLERNGQRDTGDPRSVLGSAKRQLREMEQERSSF